MNGFWRWYLRLPLRGLMSVRLSWFRHWIAYLMVGETIAIAGLVAGIALSKGHSGYLLLLLLIPVGATIVLYSFWKESKGGGFDC